MSYVALYEEWLQYDNGDLTVSMFNNLRSIHKNTNKMWLDARKPWLNTLSESVMPLFTIDDFKREVLPQVNESKDYRSIQDAYAIYELGLLRTHRPDWFLNENSIIALPNYADNKVVLCKNGSMFIISMSTWRAVNENWFSDMIDKGKELAGDAWEGLKQGAKDTWAFISKVTTASWDYSKNNPNEVIASILNILSGIISFAPVVGQIVAPILTTLAGSVEIHGGYSKISKGFKYLSEVKDPVAKTIVSVKEGIPYLFAGIITLFLGSLDLVTGIKTATPGVGAIQATVNKAALNASEKMGKTFLGKLEGGVRLAVESLVKRISKKTLPNLDLLGDAGAALLLIFLVKIGKGVLGKTFEVILDGIGAIGEGFEYLIDIPNKISDAISQLSKKADSTATKLIAGALENVVKPITSAVSKFIDNNIKPIVEPVTSYLKMIPENYKATEEELNKHLKDISDENVEIQRDKIEDKGDIKMSSEDKDALNKLTKKEGKSSEKSGENKGGGNEKFEKSLKDADSNFKGIKGKPKKLTVEFEGWGDKKKDAWKKEMSMEDLAKNMKSKDWKKIRFEYDGKYPTDLHKGGGYVRLKAIKESAILLFNEWVE